MLAHTDPTMVSVRAPVFPRCYADLWAESLVKKGLNRTPIVPVFDVIIHPVWGVSRRRVGGGVGERH